MKTPIQNIREIIDLIISDRIDISDLTKSQRKEIYYHAEQMIHDAISSTDQIVQLNPHQNFDRMLKANSKYINGLYLKSLIDNFVEPIVENQHIVNYNITNVIQSAEIKPKPESKANKAKNLLCSLKWVSNPNRELPELYNLMLTKYQLIAPDTTLEQFRAIFTGQAIDNIEPVKWISSIRLLAYFLDTAFSGQNWQSIAGKGKLFLNKKDTTITANGLAVAKKDYSDFGKPKGYKEIDLILKAIKKP